MDRAGRLVALTVAVRDPVDLNSVCRGEGFLFVREGIGAAGRGEVHRCDTAAVPGVLAGIEHRRVGTEIGGPLAFGAVPFARTGAGRFVLPRLVVQRHPDGDVTMTVTSHDESDLDDGAIAAALAEVKLVRPNPPSVNSFTVRQRTPVDRYLRAVTEARDAVRAGRLAKVVIARDIEVEAEQPIDLYSVLLRLRTSFATSHRFCIDGFIGASPELLVERTGRRVRSHPLAGTAPRTGDPATDARLAEELVASTKNQVEHRVVIDMVHDTLLPRCSFLDWEPEPSIVTVANVQHLGTMIEGVLSDPPVHVLDLVADLNPTPALGGSPGREAVAFIEEHEHSQRGLYGGAVGWVDADGDGTWAVAIRCAEVSVDRRRARLFAGGGIVAESDPVAELAETQAKFQAMLSAIVRP
jgi:menaquinone-specific isochorismate synthase